MNKKWIGLFLLLVLTTQVFPVAGLRFWSNLLQAEDQVSSSTLLVIEEEEVEQVQFKLKNIDSNQAHFYERLTQLSLAQANYMTVPELGNVIDRNDPILIPPPNPLV